MKSKRMGRRLAGFLAGTLLVGMLAGCGASGAADMAWNGAAQTAGSGSMKSESYDGGMWNEWSSDSLADEYYESEPGYESSTAGDYSSTKADSRPGATDTKRKLIKTVNMNVETQEYDTLMFSLENRINELGGYIENLESYNGSSYGGQVKRNATMTVRIPQANLSDFVSSVSDLANIVRRTENVEDVTLSYVDLKSHKEALQVEHDRLLELLERAETLEDIITLENRLTSIRYQIERMESQLRTYDDKVDFSTVYLRIDEVKIYTPVKEDTPWERMVKGFSESLEDIRDGFVNFGIWVVINSPYLLIWGVVIAVIVLVIRKKLKKRKEKKAEKKAQQGMSPNSGKPAAIVPVNNADNAERKTDGAEKQANNAGTGTSENNHFFDNTSENK